MADLSRKTASIYINHAAADEALVKLQKQADKLSASIKKGEDAGKSMVKEIGKLNDTKNQIAAVQKQIDSGLKPSFNQLQALVAKTRAELRKMSESDPGFIQKAKDLNKYSTELNRLGTQIGAVKKESGGLKGAFAEMLPVIGIAAAGAAITGFFKGAVDEALEADKVAGKFMGTLENLGKADSFDRLADKADQMAARFKFLDNDDIVNVFDKLITYGKLTEAQITQLTPVIINFAAKSKKSLDEAATDIIKALEGSGRELKEYGVNVTMAMTESERLSAVMNDLGDKVNGAAEAFGETTQGQIAQTTQTIADLKEEIGTGLLPVIKNAMVAIRDMIEGVKVFFTTTDDVVKNLTEKHNKDIAGFAENIATEMGQKTIAEQQKLADSYKSIYISSQKALSDFLKSSNKDNLAERDKLLARQEQDEKIYLASQRTLNEAIAQEKKNAGADADKADKEAQRKIDEQMKKAAEEARKLQKMWEELKNKIYDPSALAERNPFWDAIKKFNDQAKKDTDTAKELLNKRAIDYKQYSDAIVRIEDIRLKQLGELLKKYKTSQSNISVDPNNPSLVNPLNTTAPIATVNPNAEQLQKDRARLFQNDLAKIQLDVITSTGKKKLQAELNLLDMQQAQELANKDLTENQKLLIEEQYRQKRGEAEKNYQLQLAETIVNAAQQVASLYEAFTAGQQAADQAKLDQNQRNYDEDRNKLERQLRQKLVSQKEYDRQLLALDEKKRKEDAAIKKKEFQREKQSQIVSAIMGGANAVISALKAPWPLDFIMAGIATAMVAAQIAKISSQKPPQYAKGGLLNGPRHSQGGMPVIDTRTGKKVAEVEGGEPFLSRETYRNNNEIVDQLLYASMYRNGARITPYWKQRSYKPINYSGISKSISTVKYFERGGIMTGSGSTSSINQNETQNDLLPVLLGAISNLNTTAEALHQRLSEPIKTYTLLSDANAAQETMDRIKKETTITR